MPGDVIIAVGSYKKGSINLEKIRLVVPARDIRTQAPLCTACGKRMTSAGKDKGYKCRKCGAHAMDAEVQEVPRTLSAGWYKCRRPPGDTSQNRCAGVCRTGRNGSCGPASLNWKAYPFPVLSLGYILPITFYRGIDR